MELLQRKFGISQGDQTFLPRNFKTKQKLGFQLLPMVIEADQNVLKQLEHEKTKIFDELYLINCNYNQ